MLSHFDLFPLFTVLHKKAVIKFRARDLHRCSEIKRFANKLVEKKKERERESERKRKTVKNVMRNKLLKLIGLQMIAFAAVPCSTVSSEAAVILTAAFALAPSKL